MADLRWAWLTHIETQKGAAPTGAAPLLSLASYVR